MVWADLLYSKRDQDLKPVGIFSEDPDPARILIGLRLLQGYGSNHFT